MFGQAVTHLGLRRTDRLMGGMEDDDAEVMHPASGEGAQEIGEKCVAAGAGEVVEVDNPQQNRLDHPVSVVRRVMTARTGSESRSWVWREIGGGGEAGGADGRATEITHDGAATEGMGPRPMHSGRRGATTTIDGGDDHPVSMIWRVMAARAGSRSRNWVGMEIILDGEARGADERATEITQDGVATEGRGPHPLYSGRRRRSATTTIDGGGWGRRAAKTITDGGGGEMIEGCGQTATQMDGAMIEVGWVQTARDRGVPLEVDGPSIEVPGTTSVMAMVKGEGVVGFRACMKGEGSRGLWGGFSHPYLSKMGSGFEAGSGSNDGGPKTWVDLQHSVGPLEWRLAALVQHGVLLVAVSAVSGGYGSTLLNLGACLRPPASGPTMGFTTSGLTCVRGLAAERGAHRISQDEDGHADSLVDWGAPMMSPDWTTRSRARLLGSHKCGGEKSSVRQRSSERLA